MSNIEPTPFGDKYVLVEHIATGGMAEIYRAQYAGIEGFAKELVVKTLREEFAARPEVVEMFLDEARMAATLTHNNVVHTYDLGEIGDEYFIAMELLKGEELVQVLRTSMQVGRPLSIELGVGIIMQSCEGLHYVHSRTDDAGRSLGLVHRDINPTNIHVGYDGTCKVLDFGIAATRASVVAKKGQVAGKIAYMAPEQLRGEVIDLRADIFALGVVLYEMVLGRRLFRGRREEVARRVLEGDIPPPTFVDPQFPPALEAIIMKALELDPADRYTNCDHFFRALEGFLNEASLQCTPRKVSAMMVELFGEGAPAKVNYDDQYDDLEDEALDFDDFERIDDSAEDDDEPPDWARNLGGDSPGPTAKRRALTIGNLEALVAQGSLDESGPNPAIPREVGGSQAAVSRPVTRSRLPKAAGPKTSGHHRIVPKGEAAVAERSRGGRKSKSSTPSAPQAALRRPTGRHTSRQKTTPGTGRHSTLNPTGPLAAVAPDAASGRTFGHGVVTEKTGGSSPWMWLIGVVALSGLGYFVYTMLTSK
ncbi:serine/threonine protein kinase [Paraliomyxa miuraensis]|uniref:serine/threonine protein kinase n=1 Tax=Paraliomyxa miuraensis TaxID=376150 RepID=UPI00224DDB00|nr:serine/threonine-protein kinase [Paraliomyxa miuraensis]MCX4245869.1 protein kinase [Paraliomyxa miuraensis]